MQFTQAEKKILLEYSRRILIRAVQNGELVAEACANEKFLAKAGVFVSLHKNQELRGCIGYIEPIASIWDAARENTVAAARNDFRFPPVSVDELAKIKIEISILTPPEECDLHDIEAGEDGVIVEQGAGKATYLPQVWKSFANKDDFFNSLCAKAGLDENCWKNRRTKFFRYRAIVFNE
ncbi:MAG: AmmeMemoRadiSam system protein A [Parcubacteria group bacterium]